MTKGWGYCMSSGEYCMSRGGGTAWGGVGVLYG